MYIYMCVYTCNCVYIYVYAQTHRCRCWELSKVSPYEMVQTLTQSIPILIYGRPCIYIYIYIYVHIYFCIHICSCIYMQHTHIFIGVGNNSKSESTLLVADTYQKHAVGQKVG